jgi:hypothetical protein
MVTVSVSTLDLQALNGESFAGFAAVVAGDMSASLMVCILR